MGMRAVAHEMPGTIRLAYVLNFATIEAFLRTDIPINAEATNRVHVQPLSAPGTGSAVPAPG